MIIKYPEAGDLPGLKALWQEAFGDSRAFIDGFFRTGFAPERCRLAAEEAPVAALYWFDCQWEGRKLAYIYAVATRKDRQGRGLCRSLMEDTHKLLQDRDYAGAVLVPAEEGLFGLYGKLGYRAFCPMEQHRMAAAGEKAALQQISPEDYALARKTLLPPGAVVQEGATLRYLATYCGLYVGPGMVFCAARDEDTIHFQEFLGDTRAIPGILTALGAKEGTYRIPGSGNPIAMCRSFAEETALPTYLGLPLD